jgi:L-ribulokinase
MTDVALARREPFLGHYGGKISSEWYFPKLLGILNEDPAVYDAMDLFVEAGDWVVWQLTGTLVRNATAAGHKACWSADRGFPSVEYFQAVDPRLREPLAKLGQTFAPAGRLAGRLTPGAAQADGLPPGVAVAVANVDAHASVAGADVHRPHQMVTVMGTSICDVVWDPREVTVRGMTGVVRDGMIPGYYAYEAGQAAVGDMLAWFANHATPASYGARRASRCLRVSGAGRSQCGLAASGVGSSGP